MCYNQPLNLGLFRSDYLLHSPPGSEVRDISLKQVEFNTISSSFGPLATKVSDLHRYACTPTSPLSDTYTTLGTSQRLARFLGILI
jgi:hypothetical protein